MNERSGKRQLSSGILVTAGLILLTGIGLFFLLRSGILSPEKQNNDNTVVFGELPEMQLTGENELQYYPLRDREPMEILMELTEETRYVWEFRSVEAWENEYTVERITVKRLDKKYRIESDTLLVICDGERVWRREGMLETVTPADRTDLHREAGLTSLDAIRADAGTMELEFNDPINAGMIRVKQLEGSIRNEYDISIETGIPVTERSYLNNMAYRMILTDSLSVKDADFLTENDFIIPESD